MEKEKTNRSSSPDTDRSNFVIYPLTGEMIVEGERRMAVRLKEYTVEWQEQNQKKNK